MKVALFGKVEFDTYAGELSMLHPEMEILSGDDDEGEAALHVGPHRADLRRRGQAHARAPSAPIVHRDSESARASPMEDPPARSSCATA